MVKTIEELRMWANREELLEVSKWLQVWLEPYTQEVYDKVMAKLPEILSSDTTLAILEKLYNRVTDRRERQIRDIQFEIEFGNFHSKTFQMDGSSCPSRSLYDTLYELYIKD